MEIKPVTNPLRELFKAGQSPWYDNIERKLFKTGEFERLINEYGIVGVTSNPTIFEKAISCCADYDEQIKDLVRQKKRSLEIYDELAIKDIGDAADMLLDVYNKTDGMDGYVSIEVLPQFAHDPKRTVEYARNIFHRLDRRNILIKVPGTREALPAITQLIEEGISVNVTLLFSGRHYEAIAMAYIEGLKKRALNKKDLKGVISVASVFVSRIDAKIDRILVDLSNDMDEKMAARNVLNLKGRAAVANSRIIYKRFKEIFYGPDFRKLSDKGARIQRVLWASTGTKDPHYRDVKYVEELIGPYTINTMPHQTLLAFHNHGIVKNTVEEISGAKKVIEELEALGISLDSACNSLQKEGVKAFSDSFNSLISSIENKIEN